MEVSQNRDTPKSSILVGFSIYKPSSYWGTSILEIRRVPRLGAVQLAMGQSSRALQSWRLSKGLKVMKKWPWKILCKWRISWENHLYVTFLTNAQRVLYNAASSVLWYVTIGFSIAMFYCKGLTQSANLPAATVELLIAQAWVWAHRAMAKKNDHPRCHARRVTRQTL